MKQSAVRPAPPAERLWLDGELRSAAQAGGSLFARALHYGTGVFEGVRVYPAARGAPGHGGRRARAARGVARGAPRQPPRIGVPAAAGLPRRGLAGLDLGPQRTHAPVASLPWANHLGESAIRGVRMRTSPLRRISGAAVPPLKFCGLYLNSVLAEREASVGGWDEALFVDSRGGVCEATGENVFLVRDGRVTAVEHPDALPGMICDTVIALTGAEVRPVRAGELREADEVFLTGTSAEIAWVSAFDDRIYGNNPVTRALQAEYAEIVRGRALARRGWLTEL